MVGREKLYHKLHGIGVCGNMLKWIKSFSDQFICRVKYGNEYSRFYNLEIELSQGAVRSCALFNACINDLISALKTINTVSCRIFADDLISLTKVAKQRAQLNTKQILL